MKVEIGKKCGPSGRALARKLEELGYDGPTIKFGFAGQYADKHWALVCLSNAGVPVPNLLPLEFPVVARTQRHRGGKGFWLCHSEQDLAAAYKRGATHKMEYIKGAREFRVHVVYGRSIKVSEKIGGGTTKNFKDGARFYYPHDFNHKKTLRRLGKEAVAALGFDFGAVDILYKDEKWYVLEVNTAPCLTNPRSDTLERYAEAFVRGKVEDDDEDY